MNNITWLDLYNFLHEKANNTNYSNGVFPWQEQINVLDFNKLYYYDVNLTEHQDTNEAILSIDSSIKAGAINE